MAPAAGTLCEAFANVTVAWSAPFRLLGENAGRERRSEEREVDHLPSPLRLACIVPVAVAAMVWVIMPLLSRWFAGWLSR
ncbi:hypothetical protein [Nocardia sp. NPDC047038]|uniref:hypothetical protein n=1 Tax=Nocardia sp. NPDC047038 TaxID=3154338 RepID=UPI0033EA5C4D